MFPDYDHAEGNVDGDRVEVRLFSGGTFSTLVIAIDRIQQGLESIRIEQDAIRYAARMNSK